MNTPNGNLHNPRIIYRNPIHYMSIFEQGFNEFALQWVWRHKLGKSWIINKVEMCKLPCLSAWVNNRGVQNSKSGLVCVLDRLCELHTIAVPIGPACGWSSLCDSAKVNTEHGVVGLVHLTRDGTGHCISLDIDRMDKGIRESLFMAMIRLRVWTRDTCLKKKTPWP